MKTAAPHVELVDQERALDAYFDALFQDESAEQSSDQGAVSPAQQSTGEIPPVPPREVGMPTGVAAPTERAEPEPDSQQVQLFKVAGLTFAVPQERLDAILEGATELALLPEPAGPIAGTVSCEGRQIRVVDTAKLVLPEARAEQLGTDVRLRCRHLLLIGDGSWALGCAELAGVTELADAEVTWRTAAGKRPWLAGMAGQRRCALLDLDGLIRLLEGVVA